MKTIGRRDLLQEGRLQKLRRCRIARGVYVSDLTKTTNIRLNSQERLIQIFRRYAALLFRGYAVLLFQKRQMLNAMSRSSAWASVFERAGSIPTIGNVQIPFLRDLSKQKRDARKSHWRRYQSEMAPLLKTKNISGNAKKRCVLSAFKIRTIELRSFKKEIRS